MEPRHTILLPIDRRLADALDLIERNCGPDARQVLLSGHAAMTPANIGMLSRTSPEYQRHVLDRIRVGHATPLKKTAACSLVYETVSFQEVISRLERAVGGVRREATFIAARIDADAADLDRGPDRLLTLALIVEAAVNCAAGIRGLPNNERVSVRTHRNRTGEQEQAQALAATLNAAAALGLLAKNVRNLPLLKVEHRPTANEQRQALDLCQQILGLARPALRLARKRWGHLDRHLWLRPNGPATRRIITHADPDGDALASAWLAERFMFAGAEVEVLFVRRERVLGCLRPGDCLVDVGNTFDPERNLYDHKPPALPSRHDSCATKLVWEHLLALGKPVQDLEQLVLAVFAWDSIKRRKQFAVQAKASKKEGFHAALDAAKKRGLNNVALYRHMRRWLDRHS